MQLPTQDRESQAPREVHSQGTGMVSSYAWCLLILPILAGAVFRQIQEIDEARYALVAKEIYQSGSYLVMHLAGQVYPDKPPLVFWLASSFGSFCDFAVFSVRLPSILSMFGCALILRLLALRWWSPREAGWAPCLFLSMGMVLDKGGLLLIDPLLTFLCLTALYLAHSSCDSGATSRRRLLLGSVVLGLAILTKGPVGLVNTGLVLAVWALLRSKKHMGIPTLRWWGLAGLLCSSLLLPVLWAGLASWREPELAEQLFYGQHVGRVVAGAAHARPVWKYLLSFPAYLLPTTIMVLGGLRAAWVSFKGRSRNAAEPIDAGLVYAGTWMLSLFLFFSIIPVKRDVYLMSAYPAAALLAARWLGGLTEGVALPRLVSHAIPVLFIAGGLSIGPVLGLSGDYTPLWWSACIAGVPFLIFGILALRSARRQAWQSWAGHQVAGLALGVLLASCVVLPQWNRGRSAYDLADRVQELVGDQTMIPCVGVRSFLFRFYADLPAVDGRIEEALASQTGAFIALVDRSDFEKMDDPWRARFKIMESWRMGHKEVLILTRAD